MSKSANYFPGKIAHLQAFFLPLWTYLQRHCFFAAWIRAAVAGDRMKLYVFGAEDRQYRVMPGYSRVRITGATHLPFAGNRERAFVLVEPVSLAMGDAREGDIVEPVLSPLVSSTIRLQVGRIGY